MVFLRKSIFVFLILIIFLLGGCAIFRLPFGEEEKNASELIQYCSLNYINPSTGRIYGGEIRFPATVTLKLGYKGYTPVKGINLTVLQEHSGKTVFDAGQLDPYDATVNFVVDDDAGDYIINTELVADNGTTAMATKLLHVVDSTPASITDFEFYLTQNATLIPNELNKAFLWMKIEDDESVLFSKDIVNSFINQSKLYINGRDMSTSGFPPDSAVVSDSGKQVVCIAKLDIQEINPILQAPIIVEGENSFRFYFEGFNPDGSGLIEKKLQLTASYPDTTPPHIIDYDYDPNIPGFGFIDFSVTDEFGFHIQAQDKGDNFGEYDPSGLASLKWAVVGEDISGTIDLSYLSKDAIYEDLIPIQLRKAGLTSGIYQFRVIISDRKGNETVFGPKTFSYDITEFKDVGVEKEKIAGDLDREQYIVGDTVRFTLDTDMSFDSVIWSSIPAITLEDSVGNSVLYKDIQYGVYVIYVEAEKDGITYYGQEELRVELPDYYVPTIEYTVPSDSDPSQLFDIRITSVAGLKEDPEETIIDEELHYTKDGMPAGDLKLDIFPFEYSDKNEQLFKAMITTTSGSPIVLENNDRIEMILEAEDMEGHSVIKPYFFAN